MSKMHPNFKAKYPRSVAAGLAPVIVGVNEPAGFDDDAVLQSLGQTRYNNFVATVKNVFSCGHRIKNGVEVHCFYASDLETFLVNGG